MERVNLGLTGGLGCGKTTVLKLLAEQGGRVIDADEVVRDLLASDEETISAVSDYFGRHLVGDDGGIDRRSLAELVFASDDERTALEAILHPRVRTIWQRALRENTEPFCVVEIPLLFEKNLEKHFDFTVCVTCSLATQEERWAARGLSKEQFQARSRAQLPPNEKISRADFVISNNGTHEFLREQVRALGSSLKLF